jgi:hypothetical protein
VNVRHRLWLPLVLIACSFSVGLHFHKAHGEAFEFVNQIIRKSPVIQRRVGEVQEVRLGILESYKERYVGSTQLVNMTLHVVGSSGSAQVKVNSRRVNGLWTVTDASIGEESINLN